MAATKKAKAKAKTRAKALVPALHIIRVGETLEQNIEGHAARRDSRKAGKALVLSAENPLLKKAFAKQT